MRVGLLAGLVGALAATVFDLGVGERILDRAIAAEHHGALAAPEPFTRTGQRGGLVAGELIVGASVGFLLAGAGTLLAPRARSAMRLWVLMTAAGVWGVVVLPAIVYPPLPPGVHPALGITERQLLYLAVVAVGIGGVAAAVHVWSETLPHRRVLAAAAVLFPGALAALLFPGNGADTSHLRPGLLTDFRIASIGGELVFWSALAGAGLLLLRRPE